MSHIGAAYKVDNEDVFSNLGRQTENSEGSSIVQSNELRRNDRKMWTELVRHFKGDTYKQCSEQKDILIWVSFEAYYNAIASHIKLSNALTPKIQS